MIASLTEADLDEIMDFEAAAFAADMQASAATYRARFRLGHVMLGYRQQQALRGVISFSYGQFDPRDPATLPADFKTWSMQPVPPVFDTVFIYNLGLRPGTRGTGAIQALIVGALRRAVADGCRQVVGEGPIPSYAGAGHVRANPDIRSALDAYAAGGPEPDGELLFRDPHLALYRRISPCRIVRVMPGFLPSDTASGGFRAMLYRDLVACPPAPED
ncbi:hypothetical protein [Ferrovibrio sp.]|uniref:hypothetical protein n=1 Tax=Ferrovibrio sp. TaxID=1917215 RepID=UPI00311E69EF